MTLVELLIASTVLVVILAALVPLSMFVCTSYLKARTRADLNSKALVAQEWIKRDLAATARGDILMWPSGWSSAYCISFPVLRRAADDYSLPMNAQGEIDWTQTIIYHTYVNPATGGTELRRTTFNPRDNSLDSYQRLVQMVYTWYYGTGAQSFYNTSNATTETLLTNVTQYNMSAGIAEVEGYSPHQTHQVYPMGTWVLNPGFHYLLFRVTGKNDAAIGRNIGLDYISMSATDSRYEAEYFLPPHSYSGPVPVRENMSAFPAWSNGAQLLFPATNTGQYVYLQTYNDTWLESTFDHETAVLQNSEITFDPAISETVCQMLGNRITWSASVQSLGALPTSETGYENATLRVLLKSQDTALGNTIAHLGRRGKVTFTAGATAGKLDIDAAYIMERDSGYNGVPGTMKQLTFNDSVTFPGVSVYNSGRSVVINNSQSVTSDLFDLQIDPAKEYIVSLHVGGTAGEGSATVWKDPGTVTHSYMIANDLTDRSGLANWSAVPATDIVELSKIVAVQDVFITYPESATYTSRILDTKMTSPAYLSLDWRQNSTATDSIAVRIRSGNMPDLSDAAAWASALSFTNGATANSLSSLSRGRFVQWQAVLTSTAPYTTTAKLRDVRVRWPGNTRGVDVAVAIEKNRDMGNFELLIDGQRPAPAALNMHFVIRQVVMGQPLERQLTVEAAPRNN